MVSGLLNYGLYLGWAQKTWPHLALQTCEIDHQDALEVALGGPGGLLVTIYWTSWRSPFQGILFRCLTPSEILPSLLLPSNNNGKEWI